MKLKKGFELREICGEHVVLSHGVENIDFSQIVSLNETAAFLWKEAMGKDFDEEGLAEALMKVYDVEPSRAREDVAAMVAEWKKVGLVEEG